MIDTTTFKVPDKLYRNQVIQKTQFVLHFTAGWDAAGCYAAFLRRGGCTAFIVDRNGRIYQTFDPRYWDTHIYRHSKGEDARLYPLEKSSIGIEIVNVGPFTLGKKEDDKNILYTYTNKAYCHLSETERYVQAEYRGKFYWQSFTSEQYASVRMLLDDLGRQFNIDPYAPAPFPRLNLWNLSDLMTFRGVTTHGNYRSDKFDIGPAWDWSKIGMKA